MSQIYFFPVTNSNISSNTIIITRGRTSQRLINIQCINHSVITAGIVPAIDYSNITDNGSAIDRKSVTTVTQINTPDDV